jgi:hypothetical protein
MDKKYCELSFHHIDLKMKICYNVVSDNKKGETKW